jgi:hypothetical protein
MNIAKVYLNETGAWRAFYTADGNLAVKSAAEMLIEQGQYRCIGTFETDKEGQHAAEEMFDLSNNPERDDERSNRWGSNRSLSVGDIVEVNDKRYVCCTVGWEQI